MREKKVTLQKELQYPIPQALHKYPVPQALHREHIKIWSNLSS